MERSRSTTGAPGTIYGLDEHFTAFSYQRGSVQALLFLRTTGVVHLARMLLGIKGVTRTRLDIGGNFFSKGPPIVLGEILNADLFRATGVVKRSFPHMLHVTAGQLQELKKVGDPSWAYRRYMVLYSGGRLYFGAGTVTHSICRTAEFDIKDLLSSSYQVLRGIHGRPSGTGSDGAPRSR